jgi:biotin carboxyl carrier protein
MAGDTLILRDQLGAEYEIQVGDASVSIDGQTIAIGGSREGEMRAGGLTVWTAVAEDTCWVFIGGRVYTFEARRARMPAQRSRQHHGSLSAPMPATVVKILVSAGSRVRSGEVVVVLEAMKMELPVRATVDGTVTAVHCREGELVQPGADLIQLTPEPDEKSAVTP